MAQTLLKVVADFETALDQQVDVGDETCTFISYLEADGVTLPDGTYGFTIDGDSENYKEFIIGSKSGTTIGSIKSITVGGVPTTGFTRYHRRGALVTQTDWASLLRITNVQRARHYSVYFIINSLTKVDPKIKPSWQREKNVNESLSSNSIIQNFNIQL